MVAANDNRAPRPLTGRTVLICLIGFFAVVFIANGIMISAAISTFGGVETASSYQAGLAFAREAAAAHAQDDLHWRVTAQVRHAPGATLVDIEARDSAGRPLAGLTATAQLAHPNDRRAFNLELTAEGKAVYPKLRASVMKVLNRFLRGFTPKEAQQLESFLQRMLENA